VLSCRHLVFCVFAQGKDTGSNPGSSFFAQSCDIPRWRTPEEAAVFSAELGRA
jgi:hypothetical protein